jgi:FYVE/RhoGEF/PH domain-containing protein 5/6
MFHFLKLYTKYSLKYAEAESIIKKYENKDSVKEFFDNLIKVPVCANLDLGAYVIKPIQRVLRYGLLIKEILSHTKDTHPDWKRLNDSLNLLKEVAEQVNLAVEKKDKVVRLIMLSRILNFGKHKTQVSDMEKGSGQQAESFKLIDPGREFLREGVLTKVCRRVRKEKHFILFTDVLLYTKEMNRHSVDVDNILYLNETNVASMEDDEKHDLINAFKVENSKKSFVLIAESPKDKTAWMTELNALIEKSQKTLRRHSTQGVSAPVWVPDSEVTKCTLCGEKFLIIRRKHHCRQCGNIICSECSKKKKDIPGQGIQRVCDTCFEKAPTNIKTKDDIHSDEEDTIAIAKSDYSPPKSKDTHKLSFKKGDKIDVIRRDKSGWWWAKLVDGDEEGYVPGNHFTIIDPKKEY